MAEGRVRALCAGLVAVSEEPSSALSGTFSHCYATGEGNTTESAITQWHTATDTLVGICARSEAFWQSKRTLIR